MTTTISSNKRIAKNAIYLYLRMFIVMIISLLSVRFLLDLLGVEDYGVYNAIAGVVTSFAFITNVLASASQRFFSFEIGKGTFDSLRQVFSTIVFIYVLFALLIFVVLQFGGMWFLHHKMTIPDGRMESAEMVLTFSMLAFLTNIIVNAYPALMMAHEDMNLYAIISVCDAILKFLAVIMLYFAVFDKLTVYPILLFIESVVHALAYLIICRIKYPESRLMLKINWSKATEILSFSGWSFFGSVAGVGYNQGVNLLFNVFIGPIANAAYAIGNQVSTAVNTLSSGFFSAMRPSMIKSIALSDGQKLKELFSLSNKVTFLLISVISIPMLVNTEFILSLWLGEVHEFMVPFTQFMLVSIVVQNLGMPFTTIAQGNNVVRTYHIVVDGFVLLCLPILFLCIRSSASPLLILALSTLIFFIAHLLRIIVVRKYIAGLIQQYLMGFLIPSITVFAITYICSRLVSCSFNNQWLAFAISSISTLLELVILAYCFICNSIERQSIISKIKKWKKY